MKILNLLKWYLQELTFLCIFSLIGVISIVAVVIYSCRSFKKLADRLRRVEKQIIEELKEEGKEE